MSTLREIVMVLALVLVPLSARGQSEEFGQWVSLFNGKDTSGWINAKKADRNPSRWKVEDGALTNIGDGVDDICTAELFDDYELELEYKVPKSGNSGVYLRGWVEVQVFDSHGKAKVEGSDAGAIYGGYVPLVNASKPAGEWNQYRIRHIGHRITVWHNDKLVQDNVYRDKETPSNMTEHPKMKKLDGRRGPIMLQGDHTKVWYRNLRLRPLFSSADGWRPLWNYKDLSEFNAKGRKVEDLWAVQDHAFTNTKTGHDGGHDLWTTEPFGNFLVHYEYRSDPAKEGGNSGFYFRDQWELQILDHADVNNAYSDGSLYSMYPPLADARNGKDQWNHIEAKVQGMKIWVWQNGKLIHDGRVCKRRTDSNTPTEKWAKAPFKLQGDHGKVTFTNLIIKPLPDGE